MRSDTDGRPQAEGRSGLSIGQIGPEAGATRRGGAGGGPAWAPGAVLLVALLAYSAWWLVVRSQAEVLLVDQIEALRADGYEVAWSGIATSGYPLRVTMTLKDAAIAAPARQGKWRWTGDGFTIHALPYALRHVIVEPLGDQTLRGPDGAMYAFTAKEARASIRGDADGLTRLSILSGETAARELVGGAPVGRFESAALHVQRDPEDATRYRLYAEMVAPIWPDVGEDAPARLDLDAFATKVDTLLALGALDARAAAAWQAAGGTLSIEHSRISWDDASSVGIDGALALDGFGRPEGTVTVRAARPVDAFAHLSNLGLVDRSAARRAGVLAAAAVGADGEAALAVRIANGEASVFGLRVAKVGSVY